MSPDASTPALAGLLLETTVKGSLLLVVVALAALALRHRPAADRHLVWTIGVVGLLALPFLLLAVPDWPVPLPDRAARALPRLTWDVAPVDAAEEVRAGRSSGSGAAAAPVATSPSLAGPAPEVAEPLAALASRSSAERSPVRGLAVGIVLVWLLGILAVLASFSLAWARLTRVARRATPLDSSRWRALTADAARDAGVDAGRVVVRRAAEPITPLTWGVLHPVVILPPGCEEWTDAQARTVLVHEASHMRRHDCLTQTLASLACIFNWFNPLAWLAGRRMLTERERACDDQVLLSGAKASDYANDLLEIARSLGAPWPTSQVSTAMARRSQIAGRLLAVLDPHLARGGASRGRVAAAALLGLALLVPLAGVRAAPPPGPVGMPSEEASAPLPTPPPARVDPVRVGPALQAQNEGLASALRRGDTEALSRFYTTDTELVVPLLPVARGRKAVRDLHEHLVSGGVTVLEHATIERYSVGSMLCEIRTTRLRHRSGAQVQSNREMTLWKWEDGEWRIHREISVPGGKEEER